MERAVTSSWGSRFLIGTLAAVAAAIHLSRAAADPEIRVLFALNAVGFLVLAALVVLPQAAGVRGAARVVLMVYSGLTAVLYLVWGGMNREWVLPLGPVSVVVEMALVAVLFVDARRAAQVKVGAA